MNHLHHNYYVSLKNNKDDTEAQMNATFEVTYQLYRILKQYESFKNNTKYYNCCLIHYTFRSN